MRIVIVLALIFFSCNGIKNINHKKVSADFSNQVNILVKKIDSVDNYYLIYGKNGSKNYKIISRKVNYGNSCKTIKVDSVYNFKIVQLTNLSPPKTDSLIPTPINYLDLEKCIYRGNTKICNEPITELYEVNNHGGLCF